MAAANDVSPEADAPKARDADRLERAFDELDVLTTARSAAEAAHTAAYVLERLVPRAHVAIGLYDIDADLLRFVVARSERADVVREPLPLSSTDVLAEHAREGRSARLAALGRVSGAREVPGLEALASTCIVPFFARGRLRGVVQLVGRVGRAFDASDASVAEYVASRVASVAAR